jgi:hypothetical protein
MYNELVAERQRTSEIAGYEMAIIFTFKFSQMLTGQML